MYAPSNGTIAVSVLRTTPRKTSEKLMKKQPDLLGRWFTALSSVASASSLSGGRPGMRVCRS
jgi:hypothetical protein